MCRVIKPESSKQEPKSSSICSLFLAGSIEMGTAEDWQNRVTQALNKHNITIYNPRRGDWDSSWSQDEKSQQFNYQVNWEISKLIESDHVLMYFSPETKSPISMLELGFLAREGKLIVCCPDGFWKKGNIQIMCSRFNIPLYNDLNSAVGAVLTKIHADTTRY